MAEKKAEKEAKMIKLKQEKEEMEARKREQLQAKKDEKEAKKKEEQAQKQAERAAKLEQKAKKAEEAKEKAKKTDQSAEPETSNLKQPTVNKKKSENLDKKKPKEDTKVIEEEVKAIPDDWSIFGYAGDASTCFGPQLIRAKDANLQLLANTNFEEIEEPLQQKSSKKLLDVLSDLTHQHNDKQPKNRKAKFNLKQIIDSFRKLGARDPQSYSYAECTSIHNLAEDGYIQGLAGDHPSIANLWTYLQNALNIRVGVELHGIRARYTQNPTWTSLIFDQDRFEKYNQNLDYYVRDLLQIPKRISSYGSIILKELPHIHDPRTRVFQCILQALVQFNKKMQKPEPKSFNSNFNPEKMLPKLSISNMTLEDCVAIQEWLDGYIRTEATMNFFSYEATLVDVLGNYFYDLVTIRIAMELRDVPKTTPQAKPKKEAAEAQSETNEDAKADAQAE